MSDVTKDMDRAAELAKDQLEKLDEEMDSKTIEAIAQWWSIWYLKAGHKRLGRILVSWSKR